MTKAEELQIKINELNAKSQELKDNHTHGDWDNWRMFTDYEIRVKELTIELLQLDVKQLKDAQNTYSNY